MKLSILLSFALMNAACNLPKKPRYHAFDLLGNTESEAITKVGRLPDAKVACPNGKESECTDTLHYINLELKLILIIKDGYVIGILVEPYRQLELKNMPITFKNFENKPDGIQPKVDQAHHTYSYEWEVEGRRINTKVRQANKYPGGVQELAVEDYEVLSHRDTPANISPATLDLVAHKIY